MREKERRRSYRVEKKIFSLEKWKKSL